MGQLSNKKTSSFVANSLGVSVCFLHIVRCALWVGPTSSRLALFRGFEMYDTRELIEIAVEHCLVVAGEMFS